MEAATESPAPRKKVPRRTAAEWALIRVQAESGESIAELARRHGLSRLAIRGHAKKEGWRLAPHKNREMRLPVTSETRLPDPEKPVPTGNSNSPVPQETPETPENLQCGDTCNLIALPQDLLDALTAAANAEPGELQQAFGRVAQVIVSRGITSIPLPRTVQELKTWFEIFRKAHGLDQPAPKDAGQSGLLGSLRTVTRRTAGPVVEVPAETGEPVAGDLDGWDMEESLG